MDTSNYIQQHNELLQVATKISGYLNTFKLTSSSREVRDLLLDLSGKLKNHLQLEDNFLYPALLKTPDSNIVTTTTRFKNEMGQIAAVFISYINKWKFEEEIKNNPDAFIKETKALFDALGKRIQAENSTLYPLAAKV